MRTAGRHHVSTAILTMVAAVVLLLSGGCGQPEAASGTPTQQLANGWLFFAVSDFDRAEQHFNQVLTGNAEKAQQIEALYGLASVHQHRKPAPNTPAAIETYERVATLDKGGDFGAWSALSLARIDHLKLYEVKYQAGIDRRVPIILGGVALAFVLAFLLRNKPKYITLVAMALSIFAGVYAARKFGTTAGSKQMIQLPKPEEMELVRRKYQRVIDEFPGRQAADEAAAFYGVSLTEQLRVDDPNQEYLRNGLAYMEKWVAANPKSPYQRLVYGQLAQGYESLKDYRQQLKAMLKAVETCPDKQLVNLSMEYYRIAAVADLRANEPELARTYYQKLLDEYPTDYHIFLCKRALQRLNAAPATQSDAGARGEDRS